MNLTAWLAVVQAIQTLAVDGLGGVPVVFGADNLSEAYRPELVLLGASIDDADPAGGEFMTSWQSSGGPGRMSRTDAGHFNAAITCQSGDADAIDLMARCFEIGETLTGLIRDLPALAIPVGDAAGTVLGGLYVTDIHGKSSAWADDEHGMAAELALTFHYTAVI